jgi:hypothetical protein
MTSRTRSRSRRATISPLPPGANLSSGTLPEIPKEPPQDEPHKEEPNKAISTPSPPRVATPSIVTSSTVTPMIATPSTVTSTSVVGNTETKARELMKDVFAKLEGGNFREALRTVNEILNLIGKHLLYKLKLHSVAARPKYNAKGSEDLHNL